MRVPQIKEQQINSLLITEDPFGYHSYMKGSLLLRSIWSVGYLVLVHGKSTHTYPKMMMVATMKRNCQFRTSRYFIDFKTIYLLLLSHTPMGFLLASLPAWSHKREDSHPLRSIAHHRS